MILDYDSERTFQKSLEISDFGNCCIRGTSEKTGLDYYISIQTIMGTSYILKVGPVCADFDGLDAILEDNELEISFKKTKYSEKTLTKEITKYINDLKKNITIAELTSINEAIIAIPNAMKFNMDPKAYAAEGESEEENFEIESEVE